MFEHVLVGVDGRDGGRDAIALARDLAGVRARCVLATVVTAPAAGRAAAFWQVSACRYAQSQLDQQLEQTGLKADTVTVCDRSVGHGLRELADREHADLVVVGTGHRGHLARLLVGDDALGTLDRSRCAVAIAPAGYRDHAGAWETIGVGDDGSRRGADALAVACQLGRAHNASVRARSVIGPESLSYRQLTMADWSPAADALEARRQARLDALPGVQGEVRRGDTAELLLELAADVELLVVATRAQGPIARRLNGSVSRRLTVEAGCALLILPPGFTPAAVAPAEPSPDPRALGAARC